MKNTLKILALLIAACMILCVLCSCGGDGNETEKPNESETQPAQSETEPAQSETEPAQSETEPETEEETGDPAIEPNTDDAGKGEWTDPV